MLTFRFIRITLWPEKGWRVLWRLASRVDYPIHIERSDGPRGPWERLGTVASSQGYFFDEIHTRALWKQYFWRLIVVDQSGSPEVIKLTSEPHTYGTERNRIVAEVIRAHDTRLKTFNNKFVGFARVFACYKKSTYGDYCPNCVDGDTGREYRDKCAVCFGSRYVQGWMNPIVFSGYFMAPFEATTIHGELGKSQEMRNTLRTGNAVILEPEDMLVERYSGMVWRVASVTSTRPSGILVSQNAEVEALPRDRVECMLPFPEGDQLA